MLSKLMQAFHPCKLHAFNKQQKNLATIVSWFLFPQTDKKLLLTAIRKAQSFEMLSLSECIPWMTVSLAESVAIVTLNLCTIIVFMRNRNLRKRSTYLVMNLAVIDMFTGVVVVHNVFYGFGLGCSLWERYFIEYWTSILIEVLLFLFPIASLTNITIIALERVHATFCPLRHRVLKKWVYGLIIAVVWIKSGLVSVSSTPLFPFEEIQYHIYLGFTFISICLVIICVSYTSIVIKVRCGAQPQHHGAASRERKLTMTLLIVTVVSLLLYLPFVVINIATHISKSQIFWSVPFQSFFDTTMLLFYANSVVNPILYVIRIPEYRSAFFALFRRRAQRQRQAVMLPLRNMKRK